MDMKTILIFREKNLIKICINVLAHLLGYDWQGGKPSASREFADSGLDKGWYGTDTYEENLSLVAGNFWFLTEI